jgi:hypothetical protein
MPTPNQKADARPIAFCLHNQATGASPVKVDLVIRPEDLTRNDTSRLAVTQTLGGAWADNFGEGVPTVTISGTTGWGQGDRKNGLEAFLNLHENVYRRWHSERAKALEAGLDPDLVKLIFSDGLDEFTWVVAPQSFVLRRNKARPLLSQYQIAMTWLSDDVSLEVLDTLYGKDDLGVADSAFDSFGVSLQRITDFCSEISGEIGRIMGPLKAAFASFTALTARVLTYTQKVLSAAMGVVTSVTAPLMNIAANLSRAAANVCYTYQSIISFPDRVKAQFARVAAAFSNVVCLFANAFKKRKFLANYDDLYGASNCSSTAGGRAVSQYATENPFPVYFPVNTTTVSASSSATNALSLLASADPVLNPMSTTAVNSALLSVNGGLELAA